MFKKLKALWKKDSCKDCKYYCEKFATCHLKKCAGMADGFVSKFDRMFCEAQK